MNVFANALLGKLNWHVFPTTAMTAGAAVGMFLLVFAILALITYKRRWKWLWKEWLTSPDPKKIGVMYIVCALIMLVRGGSDALLLRAQQAASVGSSNGIVSANTFQQIFSAHGTIMIFFVGMGLLFGLVNLVLPMMIGSRDVAFPFLNLTSFWLFVSGMILVNLSLAVGEFSAAGWLAYPPLSELQFSPGVGVDYWIWSLQIAGIGSLLSGINFFVTIIKMRCPGMTLMKMPMFVWSVLCTTVLIIFAFPILTATITMLYLDRTLGMHFFTSGAGGNMMMYVNLIWAWGHPEVYILVLPAFGIFSEVVATFSRKRLFGYTTMVWALVAITVLSFSVWLHHFFTMGAGADVNGFFGIMTMVIAIPTGVKIFNWLFTMFRGKIHFATPMYWFLGFIGLFTIGGVAGVIMAIPPADFQLHNSLFLVAHFHTMIVSGVLFGYFAGLIYWFPKIFGFKLSEFFGKYAFWCWFIGFILAFVPLYILGLMGATRRLNHYGESTGWHPLFVVAGIGAGVIALGVGFLVLQLLAGIYIRKKNIDKTGDPWNGRTLEWSIPSPAPFYNFAVTPVVHTRDAFWEMKHSKQEAEKPKYVDILMPKNTSISIIIGAFSLLIGFGAIWHIWWMAGTGLLGVVASIIVRISSDDTDYVVTAEELKRLDSIARGTEAQA